MIGVTLPQCILIVDDHKMIRRILRSFLEDDAGLHVCGEAVDGYDAIEKAQELQPDLIILDLSMPGMSGIDAARILKQMLPRTPIVLFTFFHDALSAVDTRAAGIDAVVAKDGGISVLGNRVRGLLQASQ